MEKPQKMVTQNKEKWPYKSYNNHQFTFPYFKIHIKKFRGSSNDLSYQCNNKWNDHNSIYIVWLRNTYPLLFHCYFFVYNRKRINLENWWSLKFHLYWNHPPIVINYVYPTIFYIVYLYNNYQDRRSEWHHSTSFKSKNKNNQNPKNNQKQKKRSQSHEKRDRLWKTLRIPQASFHLLLV